MSATTSATIATNVAVTPTTTRLSDCRKFSPNIFNKSKCSHCFRQREEHSAAALECNRASRKISKCGYLFVAPDWDFSNPLYRTKRWQRRWFVLYDDGELTYSVDDHPETVPQACIDMTKVLEVAPAEDVTGHPNSIAITAPDRVTFVKGTCSEESKWWLNILAAFPKSKGRHKRNATFPGGQATTMLQKSSTADTDSITPTVTRNRHNSYTKEAIMSAQSKAILSLTGGKLYERQNSAPINSHTNILSTDSNHEDDEEDDGVETGEDADEDDVNEADMEVTQVNNIGGKNSVIENDNNNADVVGCSDGCDENNRNAGNEICNKGSSCILIKDLRGDKKSIKDLTNTITNLTQQEKNHHRWTKTSTINHVINSQHHNNNQNRYHLQKATTITAPSNQDKNSRDETDFHHYVSYSSAKTAATKKALQNNINQQTNQISKQQQQHQQNINQIRPKSLPLAANTAPAIVSAIVKKIPPVLVKTSANLQTDTNNNDNHKNNNNINNSIKTNSNKSSPRTEIQLKYLQQQKNQNNNHHQRGDPDGGCNLDDLSKTYLSKTSELSLSLQSATTSPKSTPIPSSPTSANFVNEFSMNIKRGWLFKQDNRTGDWTKHWFTLNGAALFYYRDAVCEERGVLDGVLDVNSLTQVNADDSASKGYGFTLTTWDKRRLTLASLSPNSRTSWMASLRNAAGLQITNNCATNTKVTNKPPLPKDVQINVERITTEAIEQDFLKAQQGIAPKNLTKDITFTSTTPPTPKSANSHMSSDEEYRTASEGGRRDSLDWGSPLSPSPPTLSLLRIKERVRARSTQCPRLHKRSRSSPPSSRRSTLDSVGSDEMLVSPIISTVQEELSIDKELHFRLRAAEKECDLLRSEAKQQEKRIAELLDTLERTEQQLNTRLQEMEQLRNNLQMQLETSQQQAENMVGRLTSELESSKHKIKDLEDRLLRGIEENETLYKRLRELESCSPSNFTNLKLSKIKRMDSLSDLTTISDIDPHGIDHDALVEEYNELRSRFEKAVNEIRAMKRELKQSQNQYDSLEISYASLKQDFENRTVEDRSQLQMMAARIQDLTLKYSSSERQVRTLKQKLAKSERRRSLSLKGSPKEQFSLPKEFDNKVSDIERKVDQMEQTKNGINNRTKKTSSRRSSAENSGNGDSLQLILRVNDLEQHVEGVKNVSSLKNSFCLSPHLISRLRSLESVLLTSKDRLETSLQQLQNYRIARTRRSLSPSNTERKDCYRQLERSLNEVLRLLQDSCESCLVNGTIENGQMKDFVLINGNSLVKSTVLQLENQLRNKLKDLLKQRRVLRDQNALTHEKNLELIAKRLSYESIVFGQLREALNRAENKLEVSQIQKNAEIAETTHLMCLLKSKLSGKSILKQSSSTDLLAGVLARRLLLSISQKQEPKVEIKTSENIEKTSLQSLLQQKNELSIMMKRYKMNALEHLATGLAAETLSYMPGNDMVQGAVQEAWRQAQEAVNTELVQTEIAQVMMKHAERLENMNRSGLGFILSTAECLSFEQFSDAVHIALRKEMELAANQLSEAYKTALANLKRDQWNLLHLEQEPKASETRQRLAEFADMLAHKALVDSRINVLLGDNNTSQPSLQNNGGLSFLPLTKYEDLFEELSNEIQIKDPSSILVEADFDFIFKQQAIEYEKSNNQPILSDISTNLTQLENCLVSMQNEINTSENASIPKNTFDSFEDVSEKCCFLRTRAESLMQDLHRRLQDPCHHCTDLRSQLDALQQQHESEFLESKQQHALELNTFLQKVDQQRQALQLLETDKQNVHNDLTKSQELIKQQERNFKALQEELAKQMELIHRFKSQEHKFIEQEKIMSSLHLERDNLKVELTKEKERRQLFEKRLEMLEAEHTKQMDCLQEAYREQLLAQCSDFSTSVDDEESFRQRYQMEIEQLRTLCEKGLSAMESSHRRIISDLKETHQQEIERLLLEKETALAEETQATLAALDAMRKAHQSEVQREVSRFKQEFFKQIQRGEQYSIDSAKAKEEELEELRKEILSFSEKYSIKCVENAALEEKLQMVCQKLKHLQQMQQLELRNKQFRAHLASEDLKTATNFVQGLTTNNIEETSCEDSELYQIGHTKSAEVLATENENNVEIQGKTTVKNHLKENLGTEKSDESTERTNLENDDLDLHIKKRWSYEPCYNLRIHPLYFNPEGLKTSTFGKDLRTPAKSSKPSSNIETSSPASSPLSVEYNQNSNDSIQ